MNNNLKQYEIINDKLKEEANSIDEVIHLIEFIDNIQKPEQRLEELENHLNIVKMRKDFLDRLYIPLDPSDFDSYLRLLTFPSFLLAFLKKRRTELENQRSRLSNMMNSDR